MLDLALAIPTLVGSVLSMFAAGSIFICYLVLPPHRHFRHTLILNLAAADFFNALNNSISGTYALVHRSIPPGGACTLNGLIGQLTVQGTDFSVLFIAIATVITLRRSNYKPSVGLKSKLLITMGIWFVPLCTSFTGLILDDYKPVSGNWCWLSAEKPELRYALGHGWRLAIIFTVVCLYTYLFIHMHRHFSNQKIIAQFNIYPRMERIEHWSDNTHPVTRDIRKIYVHDEFEVCEEPNDWCWNSTSDDYSRNDRTSFEKTDYFKNFPTHPKDMGIPTAQSSWHGPVSPPLSPFKLIKQTFHPSHSVASSSTESSPSSSRRGSETSPFLTRDPLALVRIPPPNRVITTIRSSSPTPPVSAGRRELHIQKLLLFNAYPIGYVLLWIPGIANRLIELSGNKSRGMAIAQASTQFVGLANALVYGYNERIWGLAKLWWESKRKNSYDAQRDEKRRDSLAKMEISWPISR